MSTQITRILSRISSGSEHGIEELIPLVYDQMKKIASNALRNEGAGRCDPTELVHEAYIRLIGTDQPAWESRAHFFAACAVVIRRILVDQARAAKRQKRGGSNKQVDVEVENIVGVAGSTDIVDLDEALRELEQLSHRQARLVELRFFGGLSETEASEVLQVSRRTLSNDWVMAKAWLKMKLDH